MNTNKSLSNKQKITVIYRVEPGCLGPDGKSHIDEFCRFAENNIVCTDLNFIQWVISPRHGNSLPEIQYKIADKNLAHDKAKKYFSSFGKDIDDFEGHISDYLVDLIDQFLGD